MPIENMLFLGRARRKVSGKSRRYFRLWGVALLITTQSLLQGQLVQAEELLVSAAVSLKAALTDIKSEFERVNRGSRVFFNFGSSGELARQLEQGANVDIFISAAPEQVDMLTKESILAPGGSHVVATNALVVIAPSNCKCVAELPELAKLKNVAIGDPALVPAGNYARQALTAAGIYERMKESHKLVFTESARQVLTYVESGNVDAGIAYITDTKDVPDIKVCLNIPDSMTKPIIYCAAITRQSSNKRIAQEFMKSLQSQHSIARFKAHGFGQPK